VACLADAVQAKALKRRLVNSTTGGRGKALEWAGHMGPSPRSCFEWPPWMSLTTQGVKGVDRGFGSWVAKRAFQDGSRTALIDTDSGRRVSLAELESRTNALSHALHELGVRRGDRVGLLMLNSAEFMETLIAVAKLGAISVPINFRLSPVEIAHILVDAGVRTLFRSEEFAAIVDEACGRDGVQLRDIVTVPRAEVRGGGENSEYEGLLASGPRDPRNEDVALEDVALIMYTSGTTGRSKGAVISHSNLLWSCVNYLTLGAGVSRHDRSLSVAPLFHIGALLAFGLPMLYVGGTHLTQAAFDPARTLQLLADENVTIQFLVPSMWAQLAEVPDFEAHDLSSLKNGLSGGAPCPLPVIEYFLDRGVLFLEGYGLTETTAGVSALVSEFVTSHAGTVGRALMHVDTRVIDEAGHDVGAGDVGELATRGPSMFQGYWGLPDETDKVFRDGWFCTGDLARIDEDGFITIVDRKKDMVISGGENVYPAEVEQVLVRHPAIREVAVIGAPDDRWGEKVTAVVALRESEGVEAEELIEWTRERIARFKAPREVVFVPELPRNATGKVLKRELRRTLTGSEVSVQR
jgi:fatty-acyl-CoA synthase